MKNMVKAILYTAIGFLLSLAAVTGIVKLYFSGTFLPVYVGNTYVVGNQIVRYEIYALLAIVVFLSCGLIRYGINFLTRKIHKNKRRL